MYEKSIVHGPEVGPDVCWSCGKGAGRVFLFHGGARCMGCGAEWYGIGKTKPGQREKKAVPEASGLRRVENEMVYVRANRWTNLRWRGIREECMTSPSGSVTYVRGVDYELDSEDGRILGKEDGAMNLPMTVSVAYRIHRIPWAKTETDGFGKVTHRDENGRALALPHLPTSSCQWCQAWLNEGREKTQARALERHKKKAKPKDDVIGALIDKQVEDEAKKEKIEVSGDQAIALSYHFLQKIEIPYNSMEAMKEEYASAPRSRGPKKKAPPRERTRGEMLEFD